MRGQKNCCQSSGSLINSECNFITFYKSLLVLLEVKLARISACLSLLDNLTHSGCSYLENLRFILRVCATSVVCKLFVFLFLFHFYRPATAKSGNPSIKEIVRAAYLTFDFPEFQSLQIKIYSAVLLVSLNTRTGWYSNTRNLPPGKFASANFTIPTAIIICVTQSLGYVAVGCFFLDRGSIGSAAIRGIFFHLHCD